MSKILAAILRTQGEISELLPQILKEELDAQPLVRVDEEEGVIKVVLERPLVEAPAFPEFPVEEAKLRPETRLAYQTEPRSLAADRFRLLRMKLKAYWTAGKLKKLLITGALAHDGKSTVLLNLATALAERGKHTVLVVDADLHHASVTETLGLKAWAGLTDCLVDDGAPLLSAIRRIEPLGWFLLPAGEPCKNPTELLQTRAFGNILDQLTPCFDWILIGSPPVLSLTDSISLQQHADAALLVVRAGQTPREAVEQTIELLGNKNILGIVLNGVETRDHPYHYYRSTLAPT
jgi:capsular exopolysaccharide synthesis family protein